MKLLVVISLMLTLNHVVVHSARLRRSETGLTDKQKTEILNKHNVLRAQEGAADMELMTWNDALAAAAAVKVGWCKSDHNYPPLPGTNFTQYGTNFNMVSGRPMNMTNVIQRWHNKKSGYNYDTQGCNSHLCGIYLQVVWAKSRQVGCAYHKCDKVKNTRFENAELLACNYVPSGNMRGQKPFKKGPACSKCGSGAGWCKNGLCNSQCSEEGDNCSCAAVCHNCATLNATTCTCSCVLGWDDADCSKRCEETHVHCNPLPGILGWPPSFCNHSVIGGMVRHECPVMCKQCGVDKDAKAGQCEPVLAPGAQIYAAGAEAPAKLVKPGNNGSQHQQQRITLTLLLFCIILSLTITWKVLL